MRRPGSRRDHRRDAVRKLSLAIIAALALIQPEPVIADDNLHPARDYLGVWLLDLESSDPIGPLMEAIEAPWIARKMAGMMAPTVTITALGAGGLRMVNENPIKTTNQDMPVDSVERQRQDPLGRKVVRSEAWNEVGQLIVTQKNYVDDDRIVVVRSTWARVGDRLEVSNQVESEDASLVIRRIFRRKP